MADNLVKRLRGYAEWQEDCPAREIPEVADRIEQLEAALKDMEVAELQAQLYRKRIHQLADALWKIIAMKPDPEFGTPPIASAIEIAREALGVKGDYASEFARAVLEGKDAPT